MSDDELTGLRAEVDALRAELFEIRFEIGEVWLVDGLSVAESLRRKTHALYRSVCAFKQERDQLHRAAWVVLRAQDACDREAERHPSSRSSAPMVRSIKAMTRLSEIVTSMGPEEER